MSVSLVSPVAFAFESVPADWGVHDCARLASAAEMAASGFACSDCGAVMVAKVGGGTVAGTMVGRRLHAADGWTWFGPKCQTCDKSECVEDGY